MNQSAASQPSRKKAVFSLLILLALTCVIVLIFRDHWAEITAALAQLNLWQVLVVLALGISYPLLEGCVSYVIVRGRLPGFTLRQGIDNAWCGTFGNVVTLGAGVVPVQTWYLHQAGLPIGPGVGLMTLQYVFHKTTVLLYATVMLLLQHKWLAANTTGVLAGAAGCPGHREPPATGRQGPLCADLCPAGAQAVFAVLPAVAVHPVHAAVPAEVCAGAAAHQPDVVRLQRSAQRGRHGLHRDRLSAAVQQLFAFR